MLRQLARLTAGVEAAGHRACAIAVYADGGDNVLPAAETGFEGVACVDDAARAVVLLCDLWETTRIPRMRDWALGLTDFLLYMQLDDGRFVNFIADWTGRRNERGATSVPGGNFWHARGVRALARAMLVFDDPRARRGFELGLPHIRGARDVPPDVRSIHALMAMELLRAGELPELRADLESWCDDMAAIRKGDVLLDNPDEVAPHLWAHLQEGVLTEAGLLLRRPDLLTVAHRSALAYLAPMIDSGFDEPTVQPYGVASAVYCVERLADVIPVRFEELVRLSRAWFDGRNPARRAVYDRIEGRVYDGVDNGHVNPHSGAESNIVGAQALRDQVVRVLPTLMPLVETSFSREIRQRFAVEREAHLAGR